MSHSKEELAELVKSGAVTDIFEAERAYALLKSIGAHADAINASEKNFGELFGTLQALAQTETLISVARLYDRPSKSYPTRCLRALLDELDAEANALPPIIEKGNLWKALERQGMSPEEIARLDGAPDQVVTQAMTAFWRGRLDAPNIVEAVERLKAVRDKRIAHNEAAHGITGPTWNAVLQLLSIAQEIVGCIGWAYLSTIYMHEGRYWLSSAAERPAHAMQRLLEELEIVEPKWPHARRGRPSPANKGSNARDV